MGYPYMELCYKKPYSYEPSVVTHVAHIMRPSNTASTSRLPKDHDLWKQNCLWDSKISFQIQGAKVGKTIKLLSHGGVIWSSNANQSIAATPPCLDLHQKPWCCLAPTAMPCVDPGSCKVMCFKHVGIWKVSMSFLLFSHNWQKFWKKLDYFFIQRIHESEMIGKMQHFGRLLYFKASKTNTSCVESLQTIVPGRVQSVQRS